MPYLELFDETLDINATENYELAVQVSKDDVSFCILDTLRNKFVMLRSYEPGGDESYKPAQIEAIVKMDDFLTRTFRKINVITTSAKSTLVPAELYEDSRKKDYFSVNQTIEDNELVLVNKINYPESYLIFSLENDFHDSVDASFPGSQLIHHLKPLIDRANTGKGAGTGNMFVHIERYFINIVVFDQNNLKFCNTFPCRMVSDIQYYVLYIHKRLNMDPGEIVYFSGRMSSREDITRAFSKYLPSIRFTGLAGNHILSYVLGETEIHRFINIFNAVNCE